MNRRWYKYGLAGALLILVGGYKIYSTLVFSRLKNQAQAMHVDFDKSMQQAQYQECLTQDFSKSTYGMFKNLYAQNNLRAVEVQETPKIPKIIHQIWLGSPFPKRFKHYQESWQKHHPDWEYKLWTDESVKQLKLYNQDLYDQSVNYGERSDILRYELLHRYGGLYVDVDFECLQPMDIFHHCYDFYIGIQPLDTSCCQLGIGLIGAVPGHFLLKRAIEIIRNNNTVQVIARTGPIHFTTVFYDYARLGLGKNVALPASYFYPCGYKQRGAAATAWQQPESFAVHHWAGSWTQPEGFVKVAQR